MSCVLQMYFLRLNICSVFVILQHLYLLLLALEQNSDQGTFPVTDTFLAGTWSRPSICVGPGCTTLAVMWVAHSLANKASQSQRF